MGRRQGIPGPLMDRLIEAGFAVVSIDYRLAPETKLPAIIEDVEDAFDWIRGQGPDLFRADPDRLAVLGSSAGGYLALTTGYRVDPRPQALVSFWGYGDLIWPWYSTPSPHDRHHRIVMTREQALAQVGGPPVSNSADRDGNGGAFYQHCRQHGIWPKEVSGWDPVSEAEMFVPYMPLRNVTPNYPSTLLVHGTADTDVPYQQSTLMAEEFRRHGVRHELLTFEGAEHGIGGSTSIESDSAYSAAAAFLQAESRGLNYKSRRVDPNLLAAEASSNEATPSPLKNAPFTPFKGCRCFELPARCAVCLICDPCECSRGVNHAPLDCQLLE